MALWLRDPATESPLLHLPAAATARVAVGKYPTVGNSYKCMRIAGGGWQGRLGSLTRGSPHYLRLRSGPGPPIATMGGPGGPPGGPRYRRGCGTKPAGTSLRSIWSSSRSIPSICPIIWCISCSFFRPFIISGDPSIPSSTSPFGSNWRFASEPKERDRCSFFIE